MTDLNLSPQEQSAREKVINAQAAVQSAYSAHLDREAKDKLVQRRWLESHAALDDLIQAARSEGKRQWLAAAQRGHNARTT